MSDDTPKQPLTTYGVDTPDSYPIEDPMRYIDSTGEQVEHHKIVENGVSAAYHAILEAAPSSAERTLAIRKLQEARMWANAAIVFNGRRYPL